MTLTPVAAVRLTATSLSVGSQIQKYKVVLNGSRFLAGGAIGLGACVGLGIYNHMFHPSLNYY